MQQKFLLRKIGKHLCHVVATFSVIAGVTSTVVSADEVKEQDQTPKVEVVQKEEVKATDEASQKKSTSIDELTQPEKSETAVVRMTAQIERESDNIDVPSVQIGNVADTTEVVKKQNVEAEIDGMISEIANEANSSELKDGNQVYKIDRMLVNKERREVDGRPQYTYSINFHASPDPGRPEEPVVEANVTVKDNHANTLIHEVKTGDNENPVNYLEDWNKYTVGDIVSVNNKAYHVEEAIKRYAEVRDVQYQHGEAKTYLDVRLREILKTTTETISFKFVDEEGSIVRDKIDTEVTAGKAESIFNLGDTIVENSKTYNVINRALELNKQELPEGTHEDFLYTITLKEVKEEVKEVEQPKEEPKEEQPKEEPVVETYKTRVTVMDENGKVIVGEYDPHKDSTMPSTDAYEADKVVTINGKQYTVKRVTLESNTSHEGDKDITTDRYNVTVKAADDASQSTFLYNAKTEYEFNGKVIKVDVTGTKFALSRDEADRGLESLTNDIQATVGQTIEVNGVKYKISKVKHIEREVYDRDHGATFLNAQVVFALEEVSQPTASQDDESNQATSVEKQEEPVVKPIEKLVEKPVEKQEEPVVKPIEKLVEKQETPVEKQDEKQDQSKEELKEDSKEESKEELKNEQPQEESKEEQKPEVKSDEKPEVKSDAKEESKPEAKPESKSDKKEEAKQQPVVAKDSSETKQLPETGIAGFLELLGLGAVFTGIGAASYLKKKK